MTQLVVEEKPRILVLGDAIVPTGFARVLFHVFSPLCQHFEIHQFGVNYKGGEHDWPWTVYPAVRPDDPYGFDAVLSLAQTLRPSLTFMLSVDTVIAEWLKRLSQWSGRSSTKVVAYCPVDNLPLLPSAAAWLSTADRLFTFTEFGRRSFLEWMETSDSVKKRDVGLMPHGVDTTTFCPLRGDIDYHLSDAGRLAAKRRLVGLEDSQLDETFIVLNANRNEERKRLDVTIRGFARFAADKPANVRLYLHCGTKDLGWDVIELARQEGIFDRLIFSTIRGVKPAFPDDQLNAIYGACEVGVNTSSAEGWGLVSFEHAATGAAQIVPAHTGCQELWQGHAEMLQPAATVVGTEDLKRYEIVSDQALADSLERLYRDVDHRRVMSLSAYSNATRMEYTWRHIAERWREVFDTEINSLPETHR